jgi:SAM-dependent methyltransferase
VRNFNLECLSPAPSRLTRPEAIRAEPSVVGHLTLVQCEVGDWPREAGASLCLVNQSLHHLANPERWLEKIRAALAPDGALVVSAPLARLDRTESPVAREIAAQVWQLLPERYRSVEGRRAASPPYAAERRVGAPDASLRCSALLPQLMQLFHFEVFAAFGHVINAFVDRAVGPNFDPAEERDRRFIDQVAALDDAKIDAGLYAPTHLLAALRREPVAHPIHYRHWTPEFCLGRAAAPAASRRSPPAERGRAARPLAGNSAPE